MSNMRLIKKQCRIFIGGAVLIAILWVTVQFVFYCRTVSHLKQLHVSEEGLIGSLFSSASGCLRFANWLPAEVITNYLTHSADKDKGVVMAILGWKGRRDTLEYLGSAAALDTRDARSATLSAVAIEEAVPFPGEDFSQEYYRDYVGEAVALSQKEKLPLRDAAILVAKGLKERYRE